MAPRHCQGMDSRLIQPALRGSPVRRPTVIGKGGARQGAPTLPNRGILTHLERVGNRVYFRAESLLVRLNLDSLGACYVTNRPYRVLAVASHPVQYMSPVLRRLAQAPEVQLKVAYCSLQGAEAM